ncbi:TetR/AcrR family transcriptional regulator [Amycolatopsis sp. YIM 10]|uniref:TetR/AcrR family transcriptional regulator n=1 Tax=Amycolatopsis sp. YIM 10 TaxID=2653857 RepID=UPI00129016B6|nr:TetR family transcriptional regulator [Amycolatopsis sp. YIM 10]QFU90500.1 transcriptional regulator BetI [Amycolatopsis sp. YIM 10]
MTAQPARRRRFDPERRERIIEAAIDVIAERGVAGTSHRTVADAADVPLGSLTYHFESLDELLRLAFTRLAERMHGRFDAALAAIPEDGDGREGVVRIICDESLGFDRDLLLMVELYVLAIRKPAFRELIQDWMNASRRSLARHFPEDAAPEIDALIEGMVLHSHLSTEPFDADRVRRAVHRITAR